MLRALPFALALLAAAPAVAKDRAAQVQDPDTRAWWKIAERLSSDAMEGRDIGSRGHDRAGRWVADQFRAAGLRPAGEDGTYFQTFTVHESRVRAAYAVVTRDGGPLPLRFLWDFSVRAADDLPATLEGAMAFAGYCRPEDLARAHGKIAICFSTRRMGLTNSGERIRNAQAAGAIAVIQVDDPGFTLEPARWPAAYARTITLTETARGPGFPALTMSAAAFTRLTKGSGFDGAAVLAAGGRKEPLPSFDLPGRLGARFSTETRDFKATNVLAVLPGSDPKLAAEHVVLSAHLDGYGFGEPVKGDKLYNGTLDDAAYVATLVRFAQNHRGKPLKRSVLLAAFTGEEKGLLGANYFVRHPTVPKSSLVADINLDQLRPLFPLKILTIHAWGQSTLDATANEIAKAMGIRGQPDREPERALNSRADHYPFLNIGVPATGFIFGYEPGTEAERRYREWYEVRYHRPQDDIAQPMDFVAAGDLNRFVYKLTETVADAPEAPKWLPGSSYGRPAAR